MDTQRQTIWRFPSRSLSGECITVAGIGLSLIGLGRLGTFGVLDPAWLTLIAGGLLIGIGVHWLRTPLHGLVGGSGQDSSEQVQAVSPGQAPGWWEYPQAQQLSPEVQRIISVLHDDPRDPKKTWATLQMGSLAYTDGGQLSEYEIVSVKPGYFANQRNRTNTANKMVKSLDGDWFAEFDEVTDTCRMKLRIPFPAAIAPPRVRPAQTVEEAIARYLGTYWEFGVDAYGKHVRAKMTAVPHVALIAGTGGGKSTVARTLIGQYQPFFGILLFDGKQADYPKSLGRLPNIIALSKNAAEYVVYMRWLWDEMNERYVEADLRKDSGEAEASFDFPPLFALIDELPSLRGLVSKADPKDDCKTFDFYVNDLLQKGRQARIHLCLISQSLRKEAVPMWWQENIGQIAFLGRVSPRSLMSDAIPEEFRNIVSSMSQSIPSTDNERGRGVFLMKEEGAVQPVEFKSYFGWSEGSTSLEEALTEKVREAWEIAAKDAKSIISLYDRIGIKVEDPSWRTLPMEEMVETPTVVITDENGLIPGMSKYDPLSLEFLGNEKMVIGTRARGRGSVTRPAD